MSIDVVLQILNLFETIWQADRVSLAVTVFHVNMEHGHVTQIERCDWCELSSCSTINHGPNRIRTRRIG